ncbi:MAG: hypothetical protein Q7N95_06590, partial [Alphaproteobacteria bacterium]|nr:hypothetical protein [Alphaproteobacteria bacterium]
TSVAYYCAIYANETKTWSGLSTLVPRAFSDTGALWTVAASGSGPFKVCRYTPAASDDVVVANALHPRNYAGVNTALTSQNFLVIAAANSCPVDVAVNPAAGDFVNSNTLVHQPAP